MADLREISRKRTYIGGRISFNREQATIDCVIRNLSDEGACLGVESPIGIPQSFKLIFDSGRPARICQVVWRKEKQIGVTFK
jgi:hypothetical protein